VDAPLNPSFEIAGSDPGEAQSWTISIVFTGWMLADFSSFADTANPLESFEQVPFVRVITGGVVAAYDEGRAQGTLENFSFWSGNFNYRRILTTGSAAVFAGDIQLESFDESLATYVSTVIGGSGFSEAFNEAAAGYALTVAGGTVATYYQDGTTIESFQGVQPDVVFSVPVPANGTIITTTPHALANGMKMTVRTTGSPPGGLTTNSEYFVVNATSTTLKLSLTLSGAALTITSSGVGTHRLHADETLFWTNGP
jgi:hypothetical protein